MRFICLIAGFLWAASASAQVLEADKGRFAADVFASICIFGQGNADAPREYVEFKLRPLVAEAQRFFLDGRNGSAWSSPSGNVAVAISEDGECLVHVRRLAASQAEQTFTATVHAVGEKGSIEASPAVRNTRPWGEVTIQRYSFRGGFNGSRYEVKSTITEATEAPMQATFSSRVRK